MDVNYYRDLQSFYFTSVISSVVKIGNLDTQEENKISFWKIPSRIVKLLLTEKMLDAERSNQVMKDIPLVLVMENIIEADKN